MLLLAVYVVCLDVRRVCLFGTITIATLIIYKKKVCNFFFFRPLGWRGREVVRCMLSQSAGALAWIQFFFQQNVKNVNCEFDHFKATGYPCTLK